MDEDEGAQQAWVGLASCIINVNNQTANRLNDKKAIGKYLDKRNGNSKVL